VSCPAIRRCSTATSCSKTSRTRKRSSTHLDPTSPCSLVQLGIPLRVEVWPGPQILLLLHYYRRYFRDEVIAEVLGGLVHVVQFLLDGVDQPPRLPRR
jgi:hypothetical protein